MTVNRLSHATSPYLLQHADNPVDWWPWCAEALALAREQNKPILLSIGYSACHWCHVMAHESFEDESTAALMNELFVNIKVDREERPDLDRIYQSAHQLLSQRPGGWPLTVFLAPGTRMPFFAGTYFPNEARHGMIGFKDLLRRVHDAWVGQRDAIDEQEGAMADALARLNPGGADEAASLHDGPIAEARKELAGSFDATHGGFGSAPKFPHCTNIELLLRHWAREPGDSLSLHMALFTLEHMVRGGLFDQVGGGFCRYSVDDRWLIPHFEKMLYDNGPLLGLCADAWQVSGNPLFARACEQTAEWVMREMQSPEGAYYSTLDADSEGEEGLFYLWTPDQVRAVLGDDDYDLFAACHGLDQGPNFEGAWHLFLARMPEAVAERFGLSVDDAENRLANARNCLLKAREQRVRPGRDDKILTAWNALMIKGMARAGRVLARAPWVESAERALAFVRGTLWRDGRLLATCKDGRAHLAAYLDDYANLIDALLELLQVRWRREDLDFAMELAEVMLAHFEDGDRGGFFFTADDHEELIHRPKPLSDDSLPAGNGVAAAVLQRLGYLLASPRYLEAAERTLKAAWSHLVHVPYAHCALLVALDEYLRPPEILVLRAEGATLDEWRGALGSEYLPNRVLMPIPDGADVPPALAEKASREGGVIYRCIGTRCEAPVAGPGELTKNTGPRSGPS